MKKFKSFIKNNKIASFAFICCVIFVIFVFAIKFIFFKDNSKEKYGDRLDGIKEVEITSKQEKTIVDKLKEKDEVIEVDTDIEGRILYVIITVKDEVALDTAKSLSSIITDNLDTENKSFYDIQILISKKGEDENFPIIGSKHKDKDNFSW